MASDIEQLRERIIEALREVYDPELPVNLYDLGLIYKIDMPRDGDVEITMTLTTPNCPVAEMIPEQVRKAVIEVPGVRDVTISLVWQPAWSSERMSEDARLQLDMMGITWSDSGPVGPKTTPLTFRRTQPPPNQ